MPTAGEYDWISNPYPQPVIDPYIPPATAPLSPNLMERGQARLNAAMKASAGIQVSYSVYSSTGAIEYTINPLTVWRGSTFFSGLTGVITVQRGEGDFLISVEDMKNGTVKVSPRKGARFTELLTGVVWEISVPMSGEPEIRYSDNTRMTWRVHLRRVS